MRLAGIYHKEHGCKSGKPATRHTRPASPCILTTFSLAAIAMAVPPASGQDNVFTGTNTGVTTIRIAVADFKPLAADPQTAAIQADLRRHPLRRPRHRRHLRHRLQEPDASRLARRALRDAAAELLQRARQRRLCRLRLASASAAASWWSTAILFDAKNSQYPPGPRQAVQRGAQRRLRPPDRPPLRR